MNHAMPDESIQMRTRELGNEIVKPTVEDLTSRVGNCRISEVRRITDDWIIRQGDAQSQFNGIKDIFQLACEHNEGINEIVLEAWSVMINEKVWQVEYVSKEDAIRNLDTTQLKNIRSQAQAGRNRKSKYAAAIGQKWGAGVEEWKFEELGENYLGQVAAVANEYTFEEAIHLVRHLTVKRLEKRQSGRGSMREITHTDWVSLKNLEKSEARRILTLKPVQEIDLVLFETSIDEISKFKRISSTDDGGIEAASAKRR